MQLEDILGRLLDDAVARGVIDGNITARDLLDTKLIMLAVKYDTMLIIVNIRRILEEPLPVVNSYRNDTVVAAGGVVHAARVTLILY